jgi:hypothetical protein
MYKDFTEHEIIIFRMFINFYTISPFSPVIDFSIIEVIEDNGSFFFWEFTLSTSLSFELGMEFFLGFSTIFTATNSTTNTPHSSK